MDGIVGNISWRDCISCRHYRHDEGGCLPLDEEGEDLLSIDFGLEQVFCKRYTLLVEKEG